MAEKQKESTGMNRELVHELSETVATLTRLGVTLVNLPIMLLPNKERQKAKQVTSEAFRIGSSLPRAVGTMLEGMSEEWPSSKKQREDLGSRLRRERQKMGDNEGIEDEATS